jgi:hypothetical protein
LRLGADVELCRRRYDDGYRISRIGLCSLLQGRCVVNEEPPITLWLMPWLVAAFLLAIVIYAMRGVVGF